MPLSPPRASSLAASSPLPGAAPPAPSCQLSREVVGASRGTVGPHHRTNERLFCRSLALPEVDRRRGTVQKWSHSMQPFMQTAHAAHAAAPPEPPPRSCVQPFHALDGSYWRAAGGAPLCNRFAMSHPAHRQKEFCPRCACSTPPSSSSSSASKRLAVSDRQRAQHACVADPAATILA